MIKGAFVGLGSNLGDRKANIRAALSLFEDFGISVMKTSSLYLTAPVGPPQPDFLNAACELEGYPSDPALLVKILKEIEATVGRGEGERWGPREIDLDLLLFEDKMVSEGGVTVPHPELTKRAFVLVPLLEMDPLLELPSGEPLSAFLEADPVGIELYGSLE